MENLRERGGHRNQELPRIPEIIQPYPTSKLKILPITMVTSRFPGMVSSRTLLRPLLAAPAPGAENLLAAARIQSNHGILWTSARRGVPVTWPGSLDIPGPKISKDAKVEHGDVPSWWMM